VSHLRPLEGSFCSVCGEALLSPAFVERGKAECGLCQRAHPPFERAIAYGSYDGGLRELIQLLKYEQVRPAAAVLGRMLAESLRQSEAVIPPGPMPVIPVPLSAGKRAQRGFNQSELIARAALKALPGERYQLATGVLKRVRETASQIGLTRHQRRENLRGAFAVAESKVILQRDVLLVDDVFTTGTTASECARVLLRAGAKRVWVATVARTLKSSGGLAVPEQKRDEEVETGIRVAGGV